MQAVQHPQRKLHPILWAAAISVIVFSIVAVGAITGLIPTTLGQSDAEKAVVPQTATASAPGQPASTTPRAIEPPVKPASKPAPVRAAAPEAGTETRSAKSEPRLADAAPSKEAAAPAGGAAHVPVVCHECGVVSSVRAIEQEGQGTGIGAVGGAVAGGVLGRQVGGGRGRDVMTVIGAIAGGVGGHEIEKNVRKVVKHEVTVRFGDGSTRSFSYDKTPMFRSGDPVRLSQGELVLDNR